MLVLVIIGLVGCDGFLGFSYLASLFVKGAMPHQLYDEAFAALHIRLGLRAPDMVGTQTELSPRRSNTSPPVGAHFSKNMSRYGGNNLRSIDEISELLGSP